MEILEYILYALEKFKGGLYNTFSYLKQHKTPVFSSLFFITYVVLFYTLLFKSTNSTLQKYEYYTNVIFIIIALIWSIGIMSKFMNNNNSINSSILKYSKFIIGITLVLSVFFILLYFFTSSIFANDVISFIINLGIIIFGLYIISYYIKNSKYYEKIKNSSFGSKLFNFTFKIPEIIIHFFSTFISDIKTTPYFIYKIIGIEIILIIMYFLLPYIFNKIITHKGIMLLKEPVYTDVKHTVGTFENLHKGDNDVSSPDYNYNYAISFWLFLDNVGDNYSNSTNKYTSLLNYGNNPKIEYNGSKHSFRVTMGDENNKTIIYTNKNIPLQKWNNIVINYSSGITDIFINGELVGTKNKVLPYLKMNNVVLGEKGGYPGGICNVIYYKNTLTKSKIKGLYEILINKKRPY